MKSEPSSVASDAGELEGLLSARNTWSPLPVEILTYVRDDTSPSAAAGTAVATASAAERLLSGSRSSSPVDVPLLLPLLLALLLR